MLKSPFAQDVYLRNAQIYKVLAHPKRLEILNTIKHQEATVGDLLKVIKIRKANLSQHLAILRHLRLVKTRREGKNIYYQIINPQIIEPCRIFKDLRAKKILL